jgi:Protein of unknown function with HXXEE motif
VQKIFWAMAVASWLHMAEEYVYPGGFLQWIRRHTTKVRLTPADAIVINLAFLALVASPLFTDPRAAPIVTVSIPVLLIANAVLHVIGTIVTKSYSPGVITATLLYFPIGGYAIAVLVRGLHLSHFAVALGILLGLGWHTIPFIRGFLIPEVMRRTIRSSAAGASTHSSESETRKPL